MFKDAVTLSWYNSVTPSVVSPVKTFDVMIKAHKTARLSEILSLNNNKTTIEAMDYDGKAMNLVLKFANQLRDNMPFALYQNTPNPASGETFISFNLPKESTARLTIYNTEGKTVKIIDDKFTEGLNKIRLSKSDLEGNGLYYYRLDTPEHSATKRMIWID
jgi:hypothetical protein